MNPVKKHDHFANMSDEFKSEMIKKVQLKKAKTLI